MVFNLCNNTVGVVNSVGSLFQVGLGFFTGISPKEGRKGIMYFHKTETGTFAQHMDKKGFLQCTGCSYERVQFYETISHSILTLNCTW